MPVIRCTGRDEPEYGWARRLAARRFEAYKILEEYFCFRRKGIIGDQHRSPSRLPARPFIAGQNRLEIPRLSFRAGGSKWALPMLPRVNWTYVSVELENSEIAAPMRSAVVRQQSVPKVHASPAK